MERKIKKEQSIIFLENGKFNFKRLNINLTIKCNCESDDLLQKIEMDILAKLNFNGCVFCEETADYNFLIPLEDSGVLSIMIIDSFEKFVDQMILFVQRFVEESKVSLNGISIDLF